MIQAILPQILLLVLAVVVLTVDLIVSKEKKSYLAWITVAGSAVIFVVTLIYARPSTEGELLWGGMLRHDWLSYIFNLVFIFAAAITTLFTIDWPQVWKRGEFYVLLLTSTLGMTLMAASADIIMLFLAIETVSIPLYVMSGFITSDKKSTEAGFKYLIFGALSSGIMLFGLSLLYGFSGSTNLYEIATTFATGQIPFVSALGTIVLIFAGFGFKISMVPFHFWAPDVYEGAPTPVAGFLSTASKAAGFAVIIRVMLIVFPVSVLPEWVVFIGLAAVLSMTVGNTIALAQSNIKRMLAYSSIAHAGYILVGVAAASSLGVASITYYVIVYMVTNLAAFGIVVIFYRSVGSDELSAYDGLSRRSPMIATAMLVAFLSLAGVPPLGGFIAKVLVFAAAVQADLVWLAILGVLNAIIGLYYYLIVLKRVYLYRSDDEDKPINVSRPHAVALTICVLGIIITGVLIAPWYEWSQAAAAAIF